MFGLTPRIARTTRVILRMLASDPLLPMVWTADGSPHDRAAKLALYIAEEYKESDLKVAVDQKKKEHQAAKAAAEEADKVDEEEVPHHNVIVMGSWA